MTTLTFKAVQSKCRELGFSLSRTGGGDYRLADQRLDRERREDSAYYTGDLMDALMTAIAERS